MTVDQVEMLSKDFRQPAKVTVTVSCMKVTCSDRIVEHGGSCDFKRRKIA